MNLNELLSNHKTIFRKKLVKALADKNELTEEQVESDLKDLIEQYTEEKYTQPALLIERINSIKKPVLLNIRRGREGEEFCRICEANQPNIDKVSGKYGNRIEVVEASVDKPDGGALYHIIFHEESVDKKVPLTAVINRGEVLKFWTGTTVEPDEYGKYFDRLLED